MHRTTRGYKLQGMAYNDIGLYFQTENIPGILTRVPVFPCKVKPKHQAIFSEKIYQLFSRNFYQIRCTNYKFNAVLIKFLRHYSYFLPHRQILQIKLFLHR